MKMEAVGKAEELVDLEVPPKTSEKQETALDEDEHIELGGQTQKDTVPTAADSIVLSSMPCLLMELRPSAENSKPLGGRVYESDSSNHCMLSPSSSGNLADSDTLSSTEENESCQAEAAVEGDLSTMSEAAVGRKSRRSRSGSETSTMAAKKNRQSSDKQNGRVTKVKRSQKHKERIRLLRQKREAAARKKYNLLQDSSTSDSDLTCDSSTSSSDDDEEVSGSSKTITAEIPDGPPVVARYDISDTNSDPEVVNVDNLLAAAVVQEHNNSLGNEDSGSTWRTRGLLDHLTAGTGLFKFSSSAKNLVPELNSSFNPLCFLPCCRCVHPRGGVIQSVSSWKYDSGSQYINTQQTQSWTAVTPQQNWSSPPEVVDLTLDEDSRRKYLL
ncbi:Uncharacterized protein C18orf25 [Calypte anna]|uniref:Uncharacterized protein C18orf25 n=1 Tax=Calypte anna TaxID=9244 RepID=A0A091I9S9_CALAN|nr:Uncharacterized protein C18orf25 [Calypte anna]